MTTIPLANLERMHTELWQDLERAFHSSVMESRFIGGPDVAEFEKQFAEYCHTKFAVGVSNGTDALQLVLETLNLQPGDEVILPVNTFIATAEAVVYAGGTPVLVDVDATTGLMNLQAVEKALTKRTRVVLPVHLYGQLVSIPSLRKLVDGTGAVIVEDAAQAHAASTPQFWPGSQTYAATFSFYPGKNLGALGDAGAVVTNDEALAIHIKKLRNHGYLKKYQYEMKGHNYRLDALQARFLSIKLKHLDRWTRARIENVSKYAEALSNIRGVTVPTIVTDRSHVYHQFVIHAECRDDLLQHLQDHDIEAMVHYPRALFHVPYLKANIKDFPVAKALEEKILSLPLCPYIKDAEIQFVCDKVKQFYART